MKKIIFALTLLFTLISCTNITENQKTATVHVSLSQYTPKTISPLQVQESSYQNVESWTITFSDKTAEREDIIYEDVTFSEATPSFTLPTGTYTATIQSSNTDTSDIIFYDSQTITLTQSQTFNLVFYVTPKKIATGNFEAEFTFTSRKSVTSSATLTSLKTNDVITLATSISGEDPKTCTIHSTNIPSGFYKFSLKFSYTDTENVSVENQEVYANNNDDLIEICDDLTTTLTLTSQIVLPTVTKVLYVTKKESSGNGQFESLPITLTKAYSKVQDNTKIIKFIFIDSDSIPQIDISQLKENCMYQLYLKNDNGYEISNQTESIIVTNLNTTNISITDSASSSKPIKINSFYDSILKNSNITISTTLDVSLEESLTKYYSILDNEDGTRTLYTKTPVMLYNKDPQYVSYADFATLSETETGTEIYPASVGDGYTLQDYIIDKSNNIFITYYDGSGKQYIKKITYDNTTNTYEDIQSDHYQIDTNYTISQIRNVGDNLYIVATTSDGSTYYLLKGTYSAGSTMNYTEAEIGTNITVNSFYVSDNETTLYTYEYNIYGDSPQDSYFIKSYKIGDSSLTLSDSIFLLKTTSGTFGSDATTVADMFVVNDYIYLLLADSNYGCILRLSTTLASDTATYSSYPTSGTTDSSNDSQYFYSPEKIVGIGSDYLLIKDKISTDSSRIVKFSLTNHNIATSKATQY